MRVCAADESVLEWIYPVLLFDNQTALDGVANTGGAGGTPGNTTCGRRYTAGG